MKNRNWTAGALSVVLLSIIAIAGCGSSDPTAPSAPNVPPTDLSVTMSVSSRSPREQDTISYTVTVSNNGSSNATSVVVVDSLPGGLTYESHAATQGDYSNGTGEWAVGTIAAGGNAVLTIVAVVNLGTYGSTVTNSATVTAPSPSGPSQIVKTASVDIEPTALFVDLRVTVTANSAAAVAGDTVTFTISVSNARAGWDATGVVLEDNLPTGLRYQTHTASQGTFDPANGEWTIGNIVRDGSSILEITATLDGSASGGNIRNAASIKEVDQYDAEPNNDAGFVDLEALSDGAAVVWGESVYSPPAPNSTFTVVSGGYDHVVGLNEDGTIVQWAATPSSLSPLPEPNGSCVAISASVEGGIGLRADGSIITWGMPALDTGLNSDFVAIAAGRNFGLGLKADGSIVAWGDNERGQCNVPEPNNSFVAIAAGYYHGLGLKADGTIVAWGYNHNYQCSVPSPDLGKHYVAVAAGVYHSLAIQDDGSIKGWGFNTYGQCNAPAPNTGFVSVDAGYGHSIGLKADGSLVAWGWDHEHVTDIPQPNSNFVAIGSGEYTCIAIKRAAP